MSPRAAILAGLAAFVVPTRNDGPGDVPVLRPDRMAGRIVPGSDHPVAIVLPEGGSQTIVSVLKLPGKLRYGDYVWNDHDVPRGPRSIRIDLRRQIVSIFRAGFEIGTTVILYGADGKPTPRGVFVVRARLRDHRSSLYDAPMPYTIRLTDDGISIHGSNVRERAATHGCVGVPTAFARHLFDEVRVGDPVIIL